MRALYQSNADFAGVANNVLIAAGAVPSNIVNGTNLTHEWGGAITVGPAEGNAGFYVTYAGVPIEGCVRLGTFDQSGSGVVGSGIRGVHIASVGDDTVAAYAVTNGVGGVPTATTATGLTPADISDAGTDGTACNNPGATSTDITWVFGR